MLVTEALPGIRRGTRSFARVLTEHIVEVCVRRLADDEDVHALQLEVRSAIARVGEGAVIWADYRGASPVSGDVAREWSRAMRVSNGEILRSALLLDPANAVFNLQIARVVRCAINPARRMFADPVEASEWVGAALAEDERSQLRALFAPHHA